MVFGSMSQKVTGDLRKLIIEELRDLYSSPVLLGRWAGQFMWLAW